MYSRKRRSSSSSSICRPDIAISTAAVDSRAKVVNKELPIAKYYALPTEQGIAIDILLSSNLRFEQGVANCPGWVESLQSALQKVQLDSCQHLSGLTDLTEDRPSDIAAIVQKISHLEESLREHMQVVLKSRNELHAEELAYGAVLQKSLQISRELEKQKRSVQQSKEQIRRIVSMMDAMNADLHVLNLELRAKLQGV